MSLLLAVTALNGSVATGADGGADTRPASRFVDLGEVVEDAKTGLVWQKDGTANGHMNWEEASKLAPTVKIGKYDRWRLPTREEMADIFPADAPPWRNSAYTPSQCCSVGGPFVSYWTSASFVPQADVAFCYQWYEKGGPNNCIASLNRCRVRLVHDSLNARTVLQLEPRPATQPATQPSTRPGRQPQRRPAPLA